LPNLSFFFKNRKIALYKPLTRKRFSGKTALFLYRKKSQERWDDCKTATGMVESIEQMHILSSVTVAPAFRLAQDTNGAHMQDRSSHRKSIETAIIFDSISDGVFTVDHDFIITSFNRAAEKITGFSRSEAIGRRCADIFRSNMCTHNCTLEKTMKEQCSFTHTSTRITSRCGDSVPISVSTALLRDTDGTLLGGVETFRDHTLIEGLRRELEGTIEMGRMISRNKEMKQIFSILPQIGESESTVLIEGETGTGKELLSRAIHYHSLRSDKPFVAINCGALPDTLLESELFGYKAGAFTGANRDKPGIFASAGRGTILLDEIGDTSPAFQVKLLRLLEEKEFQPLGGVDIIHTEARIIAATNKNLEEMVTTGTFRQDLFYRINVIHLKLPPLRQRIEDIPLLIEQFIDKYNSIKLCNVTEISPEAMAILMGHDFPGNIRELENILERAFVLCRRGSIGPHHLPGSLTAGAQPRAANGDQFSEADRMRQKMQRTEGDIILETLEKMDYNRSAAARSLGMHKSTLYRKMARLGITLPNKDGRCAVLQNRGETIG